MTESTPSIPTWENEGRTETQDMNSMLRLKQSFIEIICIFVWNFMNRKINEASDSVAYV